MHISVSASLPASPPHNLIHPGNDSWLSGQGRGNEKPNLPFLVTFQGARVTRRPRKPLLPPQAAFNRKPAESRASALAGRRAVSRLASQRRRAPARGSGGGRGPVAGRRCRAALGLQAALLPRRTPAAAAAPRGPGRQQPLGPAAPQPRSPGPDPRRPGAGSPPGPSSARRTRQA